MTFLLRWSVNSDKHKMLERAFTVLVMGLWHEQGEYERQVCALLSWQHRNLGRALGAAVEFRFPLQMAILE